MVELTLNLKTSSNLLWDRNSHYQHTCTSIHTVSVDVYTDMFHISTTRHDANSGQKISSVCCI